MKILVTGSNGFLSQHLIKTMLDTTSHLVIATGKGARRTQFSSDNFKYLELDICDGVAVHQLIETEQPDLIIHAAALTQADECEQHQIACWNVNVTATRFLIDAAKKVNSFFILLSTDFIFDGAGGPYSEDDIANPVSYYGSTKVAAEKAVLESKLPYAIVRTCLVYGDIITGTRSNIISWVKDNLQQGKPIKVVSDQWRTPTYIDDLVKGVMLIVEKKVTGIFNISGEDLVSPYDMAVATATYLQLDNTLIEKVDASVFSQPAKRPAKTGFVIDKAKAQLGFTALSFKEGLEKMLATST